MACLSSLKVPAALAGLALCLACGGGGGGGGVGGTAVPPPDVAVPGGVPRTVQGTSLVTNLPFNAVTGTITPTAPAPAPLPANAVSATLSDGSHAYPGAYNNADGTYSIPDVPTGYVWLKVGSDYIWTKSNSVNLGGLIPGRTGVAYPTTSTWTNITLNNLATWAADDYLVAYDFNSGLYLQPGGSSNGSSYQGTVQWLGSGLPLIDTTQGDAPQFEQVESSSNGTAYLFWAGMAYQPASLTMTDGASATITGNLSAIPQTATVPMNYLRSQFVNYRGQYNPNGAYEWGPFLEFDSVPGAAAYGSVGPLLDGIWIEDSFPFNVTDVSMGMVAAPALAPGFERVAMAGDAYVMLPILPGASTNWDVLVRGVMTYTLAPTDISHPLQPLVSPPKNPAVNGLSLFSNQVGVGLTPTLSWTAPDLGTPQLFLVDVYQLSNVSGATTGALVAQLYLDGTQTSMRMPLGILSSGNTYSVMISAYADSTYDPTSAPFQAFHFPFGCAQVFSGLITP